MDYKAYCQRQFKRALKGLFLYLLIAILMPQLLPAQSCLPEGITFTTQSQIDNFQINHPNCTEIGGDVIIQGQDISNLNGLNVLTSFGGDLKIGKYYIGGNPSLISLIGLDNVTSIGGNLSIEGNEVLTSLAGLDNVTSIGGEFLKIMDNPSLTSLTGLENLTTISVYSFQVVRNHALTNLMGLNNLTFIGNRFTIYDNDALTNLTGLENLTTISGYLFFQGNDALTSFTGLDNVTTLGDHLGILNNSSLTSLTGLENLTSIGQGISIHYNDALTSLTGLENLTSISGPLAIGYNGALTSLSELDNIDGTLIEGLYIEYNVSLSMCHVQIVCEFLVSPGGDIEIHHNASGCNNPEEVQDSCIANSVSVAEEYIIEDCSVYPNPFTTSTIIEYELTEPSHVQLTIYNHLGEAVEEAVSAYLLPRVYTFEWSPQRLCGGMYFAVLRSGDGVSVIKIIKQ